ncbi:MAG: tetratricopeptide repeat protein [Arcobacter sp.]|nr:tetratricopeptide repeat protein [Arcobacter sp.]
MVLLISILIFSISLFAKQDLIDSQPEILFKYDQLKKNQEKFKLQVEFNKAILLLEQEEYKKAIIILKNTSKIIKVPSFLNIGIAYYKLKQYKNALLYLENIYNYNEASFLNTYSYLASCYYLYEIKNDKKYLEKIVNITKKYKKISEHSKRILVDTYILLKNYEKALKILDSMKFPMNLKKAILYLKIKDYKKAELFLELSKEKTFNQKKIDQILWLMVYRDLKSNQLEKLKDHIKEINKRKDNFNVNLELPLQIYFNKNKFTSKEYLKFVTKFDLDRKINFVFYFAPFIFSDNEEILYDLSKGFIFKDKQNITSLEQMVSYNAKFIEIIQDDPILRVIKLKSFIKEDSNSYVYYNLALCYAQINDFHNAYKYFSKAYKLNPGNKLYSVMTIISANKINKKLKDYSYIEKNLKSKNGMYKYFGEKIFNIFINKSYKVTTEAKSYEKTIFYKSLDYLEKLDTNKITSTHPLFKEHYKDPLVYLMKLSIRKKDESDYTYFARIQDNIPLDINNNFLNAPLFVTNFYIDLLKAIGLFEKANFLMHGNNNPSYLRTKALKYLYNNKAQQTMTILEKLQKDFKLEDKYTMYLIVAALLELEKYNEASLQISLIKVILNDNGADFLTGVQLIQDLKLNGALQYLKQPYKDTLIDFRLINLDSLLESL